MEVLCGITSLSLNGLSSAWSSFICSTTSKKEFDGINTGLRAWIYNPNVDKESFLRVEHLLGEDLLVPTKERALIECMKNPSIVDEGHLCEAIVDYLEYTSDSSKEKLYEMAQFFDFPVEKVDWWISEAYEYCSEM